MNQSTVSAQRFFPSKHVPIHCAAGRRHKWCSRAVGELGRPEHAWRAKRREPIGGVKATAVLESTVVRILIREVPVSFAKSTSERYFSTATSRLRCEEHPRRASLVSRHARTAL